MKIYTRTGDDGETGLFGGDRVPKDHPRIAAYGTVDETNSLIGLARSLALRDVPLDPLDAMLARVQSELFTVGADLATPANSRARVARITAAHALQLERDIDQLDDDLTELRQFILPGGHPTAAALHAARATCRRAERETVRVRDEADIGRGVVVYLNRLSDFLFVAARWVNHATGNDDPTWTPDPPGP